MGATEWALLAAVILVPLVVAVAVTLWSLEQVRFRRKKVGSPPRRRPAASETPEE